MKYLFQAVIFLSFVVSHTHAITVAKSGGDYTTIMAGLNAANPGDTIFVKTGIYSEIIKWPKSGSANGGYIVLKSFGDGPAKVDGSTITATQNNAELLLINGKSYITVIGMEFCNFTTTSGDIFLKGIQIEGASQFIQFKNCKVHDITTTNTSTNAGANAIGVFGTNSTSSITDLLIDSCEVFNNKTGYSEAISIDGNVNGFKVSHCHVHDNNNIGILISGSYGESSNTATDQARHGIICDNLVERCSSCNNPSYKGDCSADGIYSDGGGYSVFERNIISECDIGIEAGAELATAVDDSIIVRDNLVYKCKTGGMFIGGYETKRGLTINCRIENNTFYMNDASGSGSGEFLIQKSHDNIIRNNIFYTTSQNKAITNAFDSKYCYNNTVDNNLFYSLSGASGIEGVNMDKHAKTADPLFVNPGTDFHLKTGSPAINGCDAAFAPSEGEHDLDGHPRKVGSAADIGAYESATPLSLLAPVIHSNARISSHKPRLITSGKSSGGPYLQIEHGNGNPVQANGKSITKEGVSRH